MALCSSTKTYALHVPSDTPMTDPVPLPSIPTGERAVIERWDALPDAMRERLFTLGLAPGETIVLERKMLFRGPVVVAFQSQRFALRYEEAKHLLVRIG